MSQLQPFDLGQVRDFAQSWSGDRQGLAAIALAAVQALGADAASQAAAQGLAEPGCVAVVCGQQPALGGGPLYNLIKAAAAIAWAQSLQEQGLPAVAIYWCASDDHDAGEADHVDIVGRNGLLRRLRSPLPRPGLALHWQPAAPGLEMLAAAADQLPGSGLGRAWWQARQAADGEGLGAWQCRLLQACFPESGLICIEARQLRPLWSALAAESLPRWPAAELAQRRRELLSQGLPPAFGDLAYPPWFQDSQDGRRPITPAELDQRLRRNSQDCSPGAALRPILQQLALPAAIYCAGPGELAYHRFLSPIYPALGALPPQLCPRPQISLHDGWLRRGLAAWGLSSAELAPAQALPRPIAAADPSLDLLAQAHQDLAKLVQQAHDEDHQRRLRSGLERLGRLRHELQRSLERGERRRANRPPIGHLRNWLYPRNVAQERVLSCWQALNQYGPELVHRIQACLAAGEKDCKIS
ncbi:MAG: bacillithiol biosynthesis BshC [Planctomycetota bacterium]|nr:MAG: bacillithiol biosynthesis BshC [Planctomycetota bacterium]